MSKEKVESLERGVTYGIANGKRTIIADLYDLQEIFAELSRLRAVEAAAYQLATAGYSTDLSCARVNTMEEPP